MYEVGRIHLHLHLVHACVMHYGIDVSRSPLVARVQIMAVDGVLVPPVLPCLQGWKQFYTEKSKLVLASRRGYQGRVMAHAIGALSMNTGL